MNSAEKQRTAGIVTVILLAVFLAFLPALSNGFVDWDDDLVFTTNPHIQGLTAENIKWAFTSFHVAHYHPLTWLSIALDFQLWGMSPRAFHGMNMLLHALNAIVLFFFSVALLKHLGKSGVQAQLAALAGTLFYALHPLRVESVAWATERRDVLSNLFFFLMIFAYFRYATGGRKRLPYGLALGCFVMGLMSKAMGITLPVILLIFDVFLQRQAVSSLKALLLEKLPFAIFAGVFAIVAFIGQQTYAMGAVAEHGLMDRLVQSGYGLVFYPFKTLFPVQLSPMYSLPWDFNPWAPRFLLPAIFAIGVTVAAWHWRRVFPAGLATWAAYAVMASPILGLTQAGSQIAADRYTYLPMVPFALLLAAGLARVPSSRARLAAAITTLGLCVLAGLTMQQCKVWESGMTLWEHALRLDAKNPTAYTNRGNLRYLAGDADGALADMNAAIQYKPDHTEATYSRGALYEMRKEWVLAEADYAKVLQYMPEDLQTMERYATVALHANKAPQALQATRTVLAARPQKQGLWLLQAEVHLALGDAASAEADYGRALKLAPSATAYAGRATLRAKRNDGEGALADYTAALGLNPELVNVYQNRAKLRVKMGDFKGALADVSSLLKLTPKNIGAYENRAFLLSRLGQAEAARLDLQRALSLMPQNDPRRPQFQARLRQLGPSETQ